MAEYAHPEVLVSTDWVASHRDDSGVVVVEVDAIDRTYGEGHIPGALRWDWGTQLSDQVRRDILSKEQFAELMSVSGIAPATTLILYGDYHNWFAAWAFWQAKIYGHADVRLMNGGRKKWRDENRPMSTEDSQPAPKTYTAKEPEPSFRVFLPAVQSASSIGNPILLDVRSPEEFSGEILAPPGMAETCQRGGHIPGARSVPWNKVCADDGSFKPVDELKGLYAKAGIDGAQPVITYCRIGERASHTWFVLKYLLGYENVANYDGSWTEWGNLVGAPIERGGAEGFVNRSCEPPMNADPRK